MLSGLEDATKKYLSLSILLNQDRSSIDNMLDKSIRKTLYFSRYAGDFIIMGYNKQILTSYTKSAVEHFLRIRGLRLSTNKIRVYSLVEESLQFLGYDFIFNKNWQNLRKNYQSKIVLIPNKKKFYTFTCKIKKFIKTSIHLTAAAIIRKINPIMIA